MARSQPLALGLDFGTESVRALLVDLAGVERGSAAVRYSHGQLTDTLPSTGKKIPADYAFQHPQDWLDASAQAVKQALKVAGSDGGNVVGIGVDFTSCTMLPALRDGTPLCQVPKYAKDMFAWPKLWKHHGAKTQTQRINELARHRREPWLARYGGIIGLEWFFPKMLETLEQSPAVFAAAEVWLEAGDWYVWQLVGAGNADELPRSTCQAGYKAMWNATTGYPSPAFCKALHRDFEHVVRDRMPGKLLAPGERAGELCPASAKRMGLPAGVPVSAAIIDAHAGVPGAGVGEPSTLVMVMGTSSCHMLNSRVEKLAPGIAGVAEGGILPGYFGYETGQAAVGDAFDWFRKLAGHSDFSKLNELAAAAPAGSADVLCMDWFNGCRTPLMDGSLRGSFTGLTLSHDVGHVYRSLLEASGFGVRWIVDVLRDGGVPVRRFVATGGLPHHNPLLVQIYADILGERVIVHPSRQGPALGAAILGAVAAGRSATGFTSVSMAVNTMAKARLDHPDRARRPCVVHPNRHHRKTYDQAYARYRKLAEQLPGLGKL